MERVVTLLALCLLSSAALAQDSRRCADDPLRLALRSAELQALKQADQADRIPPIDWKIVFSRDEARRKRVGEIFGEACFNTAQDYAAAAMIFQHGTHPDHFFQTFIWAKRALKLGDPTQKWLMAAGLDRYLQHVGRKQLFATQATKAPGEACWCLHPVESTFPADRRFEYAGRSIAQALDWVRALNQGDSSCSSVRVCERAVLDTPMGSVPGFW